MTDERFVSPCAPPTGYEAELLTILIEECAEVIQRATKALRFGLAEVQPGQELSNAQRLAHEIGDAQCLIARLIEAGTVADAEIQHARIAKRAKLRKYMQTVQP